MENKLSHRWHLIAHRSELEKPLGYVRLVLGPNHEIVAWRSLQDDLVVFDNVCPHRGTRLFDGPYGMAAMTCRYHGATFCAPDAVQLRGQRYALNTYRHRWLGDWLFISPLFLDYAPEATLDPKLAEVLYELGAAISHRVDVAEPHTPMIDCDWRVAVENTLEAQHVGMVHRGSIGRLRLTREEVDRYTGGSSRSRFLVGNNTLASRLKRASVNLIAANPQPINGYHHVHLYPFTAISSTYGLSYSLQTYHPFTSDRTYFTTRVYAPHARTGGAAVALESFARSAAAFNRQVFVEDAEICERVMRYSTDHGCSLPGEERIEHFRRAL